VGLLQAFVLALRAAHQPCARPHQKPWALSLWRGFTRPRRRLPLPSCVAVTLAQALVNNAHFELPGRAQLVGENVRVLVEIDKLDGRTLCSSSESRINVDILPRKRRRAEAATVDTHGR
jgi:hypothetical protein